MSWLFTPIRRRLAPCLAILLLHLAPSPAGAQGLESAVMPGKTIRGHADLELSCDNCHVRFDRSAQPRLCLDCHKAVAQDVRARTGYHGGLKETQCRVCHTDHKGREARIVVLDEHKFDHARTDFLLKGKHQAKTCASCHKAGAKHRAAPTDCAGCHVKDDLHKGGLGLRCDNCHSQDSWKDGRFDHAKTRFALLQTHARVKCADCHLDQKYSLTPRQCSGCHRQDDPHKGRYGNRCESCHGESEWKNTLFRHDRDTRFPLLERHRQVQCEGCHRTPLYREKTPTQCVACHRGDDKHKGTLGDNCDSCHTARDWRASRFDHDRDTHFTLREKHKTAQCTACHRDSALREKLPTQCIACHEGDDRNKGHKGRYGEKCETCHGEKTFKATLFNHDRLTKFPLAGKHLRAKCESCHKEPLYKSRLATRCLVCHEADDIHFGSYDLECQRCHVPDDWRKIIKKEP